MRGHVDWFILIARRTQQSEKDVDLLNHYGFKGSHSALVDDLANDLALHPMSLRINDVERVENAWRLHSGGIYV